MRIQSTTKYSVEIFYGNEPMGVDKGNVDVEVIFSDGRRFGGTFFTLSNVEALMSQYKASGECAAGLYFWCSDLIIVEDLSRQSIERCIADLLQSEEFEDAFSSLASS